jgi:hypothetical protein
MHFSIKIIRMIASRNEMGRTCGTHGRDKYKKRPCLGHLNGREGKGTFERPRRRRRYVGEGRKKLLQDMIQLQTFFTCLRITGSLKGRKFLN